jgi:hypothetical protein
MEFHMGADSRIPIKSEEDEKKYQHQYTVD